MKPSPPSHFLEERQQRLRAEIERQALPWVVIQKPANVFYLTGFRGSAGVAMFGGRGAWLIVDPRYTIQAREQASGVEVRETRTGLNQAAGQLLKKLRARRVGFESHHLSVDAFHSLRRHSPAGVQWKAAGDLVERLRIVKDDSEIEQIRLACQLTAEAFEEMLPRARPGVLECDLALELDYRMRQRGAEGSAFETIVASGSRAALPHARPSRKPLHPGELVIFDLGAILGGYSADMTRTVYLGSPGRRVRQLYRSVLEAQLEAVASLKPNLPAREVEAAARRRLVQRGLDQYFTHSAGHGVGLEIHERPRLGRREKARIPAQSVVTVEPGIYIEGLGGIRIEDTVLVADRGPEILTGAPKDVWCL